MATLYEIDDAIRNFEFDVDEETGEILNPYALDQLVMDREHKIENIACFAKELRADGDAITNEMKVLKDRADKKYRKADRLEDYLDYALQGEKFSTPRCEVSYRKSKSVDVYDESKIPKEYLVTKTEIRPDKTALKKALSNGEVIEGARILEKSNISIK